MAKVMKSTKRTRRMFSAEFKQEAVRRMAERRVQGASVQQIGRDLEVRPELLRVWTRQLAARGGAPLADVFPGQGRLPSDQEEVRRLEREVNAARAGEYVFKKCGGVLCKGVAMSDKYAAITAHWGQFPVQLMCRALDVSLSGYYEAKARIQHGPSARARADERLLVLVRAAFTKSRGRYGAPRLLRALRAQDVHVGTHRIARVMRTDGLQARAPRGFVCTTDSRHAAPIAPNRLARRFALTEHPIPHRTWVGDMTYIPTRSGWLYLAVLIDLATRLVVGWATSASMSTQLPLRALAHAIARRPPAPGATHHTDRGSQYASAEYRAALAAQQMQQSMSRKGDCWDNAVAESFFATLEHELLAHTVLHSHRDANVALTDFIDHWYNAAERQHSTVGYMSPLQYEDRLRQMARAV